MPVFDGKNLSVQNDSETLLAMILHASPTAREEARKRGRLRLERASMLPESASASPGKTLGALTPDAVSR